MLKEYTKEEFWKLYEKLPEELQEALFSVETADSIWNICKRNNIEKTSSVAKYVGHVLMGILPPEEFQETLERELIITKDVAKEVTRGVNRFIFFPVKSALKKLYEIKVNDSEEVVEKVKVIKQEKTEKEKPDTPQKDTYREPIE